MSFDAVIEAAARARAHHHAQHIKAEAKRRVQFVDEISGIIERADVSRPRPIKSAQLVKWADFIIESHNDGWRFNRIAAHISRADKCVCKPRAVAGIYYSNTSRTG